MTPPFATKFNYDKISDGYAIRTCTCTDPLSCVLREDEAKLWRCNSCYAPCLHPNPEADGPRKDPYPPPYDKIIS